jgi:hypothetical protein
MKKFRCIKVDPNYKTKINSIVVIHDEFEMNDTFWKKIEKQCEYEISSIKRVSDNTIFKVGETVWYNSPFGGKYKRKIISFTIDICEDIEFVFIHTEEEIGGGHSLLDDIEKLIKHNK